MYVPSLAQLQHHQNDEKVIDFMKQNQLLYYINNGKAVSLNGFLIKFNLADFPKH